MSPRKRIYQVPMLLTSLMLLASIVAACGGGPATTETAPTAGTQPQATAAQTGGEAATAQPQATTAGEAATTAPAEAQPTAEGPQAQPTLTAAPNAVVLNYWDMQWGGAPFMNQLQDLVTEFNRTHPDIFVNFQQLSWGDYTQKILSAVQAGNPPDISGGDAGLPFNMDAQGQALDISDLYQQWQSDGVLDDMVPWANEKWNYKGKHPGVTWQFDTRAIYYRKDLFEQAGIKVPTTWDELLVAAKALHKPDQGMIGIALPGKQGSYDTDQFYMTLVLQAGGGLADASGKLTIDSPAQLQALEFEKQLVQCCAAEGTPSWTFTEIMKAYEQGQAAMAFGGGWFIGDIKKNAPDIFEKTGVLPVLIGPGGPQAQHSVSFANGWMIYKQTKNPDQAKTFLKWMMQKDSLRKLYASDPGGKWPVYKSLLEDPIYKENELISTLAKQVVDHGVDYWYPNNSAAVGIGSMGTALTDIIVNPVISGQRQPKEVLQDAQKQLEPLFQQQGQ